MANAGPTWNPAYWSDHGEKHFPDPNIPWPKVVKSSAGKKGFAKYHQKLSRSEIESMEMGICKEAKNEIRQVKPNVRMFWKKTQDLGFPVGVSQGCETCYVYVELHMSGPVHGRPITEAELRLKGASV